MNSTQPIADICANNHGGNSMSTEANKVTNKNRDIGRIITHLRTVSDATCDELEEALSLTHQTCSARCSELKKRGLITPTVKRPTRTGCQAQAWSLSPVKESHHE